MRQADVVIVGAGLAGLVAAERLAAAGVDVVLCDKAPRVGGRCATRPVEHARLDHGAQFFTVRSEEFADLLHGWREDGLAVKEWTRGFARADSVTDVRSDVRVTADGHPRYIIEGGMRTLATHLATERQVLLRTTVTRTEVRDGGWQVHSDGPDGSVSIACGALILTPPVPQSLTLLPSGLGVPDALSAIAYEPCVALLLLLDRPSGVPSPGALQFANGPVRWLADNQRKGVSPEPAVTVHAAGAESTLLAGLDDMSVAARLASLAGHWWAPGRPQRAIVKRWRYAQPTLGHPERSVALAVDGAPLLFAGDAFGEARVEGAVRSGLHAAARLS